MRTGSPGVRMARPEAKSAIGPASVRATIPVVKSPVRSGSAKPPAAVSDVATPQLMDQMYSELEAGRSPDAALRDAKLSLLHSQGIFRKPLYWATFQLYGGA